MKKIVVIGPESTGKSTLCNQLSQHYATRWVPEFAREYLLVHGTDYTYDNLLTIAKGQAALEDTYLQPAAENASPANGLLPRESLLFIDTEMYVMKVWCEFVFGQCHSWILDEVVKRKYDLYLLCNVDLPWVKDELREYPDLKSREKLYHMYKDIVINQPVPWIDISGDYKQRLHKAIQGIETVLH